MELEMPSGFCIKSRINTTPILCARKIFRSQHSSPLSQQEQVECCFVVDVVLLCWRRDLITRTVLATNHRTKRKFRGLNIKASDIEEQYEVLGETADSALLMLSVPVTAIENAAGSLVGRRLFRAMRWSTSCCILVISVDMLVLTIDDVCSTDYWCSAIYFVGSTSNEHRSGAEQWRTASAAWRGCEEFSLDRSNAAATRRSLFSRSSSASSSLDSFSSPPWGHVNIRKWQEIIAQNSFALRTY